MEKETAKEVEKWGKEMRDAVWSAMVQRVSFVLSRAERRCMKGRIRTEKRIACVVFNVLRTPHKPADISSSEHPYLLLKRLDLRQQR